ncbi:MAG: hypothetical protein IT530_21140 [Burkholderiales bacterium]|nr:hypothetical protein [Burkholderiales bacterium]
MRTELRVAAGPVAQVTADAPVQLLPAGEFRARDGRPGLGKSWRIDAAIAARLIAVANARQTRYVIDYEHQTILAAENGKPAPAAGWFKQLEWREGKGLYAVNVRWLPEARKMIEAGQYRYISPVFTYAPSGEVQTLVAAALTNMPALDDLEVVSLQMIARAMKEFEMPQQTQLTIEEQDVVAKLGLAEADFMAAKHDLAAQVALRTQAEPPGADGLTRSERRVCEMMALRPEDFLQQKASSR